MHFWCEIADIVLDSFNESIHTLRMSSDQRKGIITFVPQQDKDRTLLQNLRPLSLLISVIKY